jgi:hypothetical protein
LAAIAASGVKCTEITKSPQAQCGPSILCNGHICEKAEIAAEIADWTTLQPTITNGYRKPSLTVSDTHLRLYAMYNEGPLPPEVFLRQGRLEYTIDRGDGGPRCEDRNDAGTPCECSYPPSVDKLCDAPVDGGRYVFGNCSFRIDDKKKVVGDSRHACIESSTSYCLDDKDCCLGLSCELVDGQGSRCVPERDK